LAGLERELAERNGRLLLLEQTAREREAELLAGREERDRLAAAWEAEREEVARLVAESGQWRAEAERLTQELRLAREELAGEQGTAAELRAGAERLAGLERELAERNGRLLLLEQTAREREAELLAGREEREEVARLVAESGQWRAEAEQRAEEEARLAQELRAARQELAELVLARQVEVTDLRHAVRQAREDKATSQESIARLQREVEALTSTLEQTREQEDSETRRRLDQEETLAGLRRENVQLQAKAAELKPSNLDQGVMLIKGAHALPGEVLRKWIGKG
ncbi:MAG: hypothetical protein M0Z90_08860, partial [Desulfobacteraceae bacterium]|nr:hypothetical protein [Desulfobacteraceae bacterium]